MPIGLTRNHQYDLWTRKILKRMLNKHSNCIDIGAHEGEFIDMFLSMAPQGKHFAFEPIPNLYQSLKEKYHDRVQIYNIALGNDRGVSSFNWVKSNPAYSGLKKRKYKRSSEQIEILKVKTDRLDNLLDPSQNIDFIKIDVEGGEYDTLRGSKKLLSKNQPWIIFEFGKGGADFYGVTPRDMYGLLVEELNYQIFTLPGLIKNQKSLTSKQFSATFTSGRDYYFIACPHHIIY